MKLEDLLNDETFVAQMSEAASLEDIAKLLCKKGLNVTVPELQKVLQPEEELDAAELDDVAGGRIVSALPIAIHLIPGVPTPSIHDIFRKRLIAFFRTK